MIPAYYMHSANPARYAKFAASDNAVSVNRDYLPSLARRCSNWMRREVVKVMTQRRLKDGVILSDRDEPWQVSFFFSATSIPYQL